MVRRQDDSPYLPPIELLFVDFLFFFISVLHSAELSTDG